MVNMSKKSSGKHACIILIHFYIVKLGLTGVYNFFLIFAQNHRLRVSLDSQSNVLSRNMRKKKKKKQKKKKLSGFYLKTFSEVNFPLFLNRRVFVIATIPRHRKKTNI